MIAVQLLERLQECRLSNFTEQAQLCPSGVSFAAYPVAGVTLFPFHR